MNRRARTVLLLVLVLEGPALPQAPTGDSCLSLSRSNQWAEAVDCLDFRLYSTPASDTAALIPIYESLGVGYMMLERRGPALAAFRRLIEIAPGHEIDPTAYLPEVISLFQTVKLEIRRNTPPPAPPPPFWTKAARGFPLGIPQAVKGERERALAYLGFQVLTLSASVFAHRERNALRSPEFGYPEEDFDAARRYDRVYKTGFCLFFSGWISSVMDGVLRCDPQDSPPCSH